MELPCTLILIELAKSGHQEGPGALGLVQVPVKSIEPPPPKKIKA